MTDAYDLVAIGAGPAGESATELASFFGHRSAVIERASSGRNGDDYRRCADEDASRGGSLFFGVIGRRCVRRPDLNTSGDRH